MKSASASGWASSAVVCESAQPSRPPPTMSNPSSTKPLRTFKSPANVVVIGGSLLADRDGALLARPPEVAPVARVFVDAPQHHLLQLGRLAVVEHHLERGLAVVLVALDVHDPGLLVLVLHA